MIGVSRRAHTRQAIHDDPTETGISPAVTASFFPLLVGALGVVFGDIGTSPLYAFQAVFAAHHRIAVDESDVLGVLSMVTWCIILVISIAYAGFILRADNQGEGGILSLAALIRRRLHDRRSKIALILAILGAGLFYGDSFITPAISVLSAMEGLKVVDERLDRVVVAGAVTVLVALFCLQRRGTSSIGKAFGPLMALWFVVIAALGVPQIISHPEVVRALSPSYALSFIVHHRLIAFIAAGAVVLTITGVEAMYADLGHFGRRPIITAWFGLIMPALLLNYYGQAALLLAHPEAVTNPFFLLAPSWFRVPLVVLATCATVIASQAVISGAFSVSRQAVRLSVLPRLKVIQTSRRVAGQIYVPAINALLFTGVLGLVLAFRSSQALAGAYGMAVTATLLLECSLYCLLARAVWGWSLPRVLAFGIPVAGLEFALFAANVVKITSGGWVPLVIAGVAVAIMFTWHRGSTLLFGQRAQLEGPIDEFVAEVRRRKPRRVAGVACYPHGNPKTAPLALRAGLEFNEVLHDHVVIVTVKNAGLPHVPPTSRVRVTPVGEGIYHVLYRIGFNDSQDVPKALRLAVREYPRLDIDPDEAMYMLSVFRIEPGEDRRLPVWQKVLFRVLEKFSANRTQVLHLPPRRTVVMGEQVEL